jgi:hypothetical protein
MGFLNGAFQNTMGPSSPMKGLLFLFITQTSLDRRKITTRKMTKNYVQLIVNKHILMGFSLGKNTIIILL